MSYRHRPRRPYRRRSGQVVLRAKFKQERREHIMKFSGWLLLIALVGFGGWKAWQVTTRFLYTADCFKIRTIDVYGGKNISASEIIALLPFRPGDNLFKVWLSEAENDIQQCKPELKKISIGRRWKRVVVHLEERHPVACVTVNTQRLGVDFENKIFPLRGSYVKTQFPEIITANETERRNVLEFIRQFAPQAKKLYFRIAKFSPEPVDDIVMDLTDGPRIYWGSSEKDEIRPKLQRLQQVMADAAGRYPAVDYINLCYFDNGRILVKPRTQTVTVPAVMELASAATAAPVPAPVVTAAPVPAPVVEQVEKVKKPAAAVSAGPSRTHRHRSQAPAKRQKQKHSTVTRQA